MGIVGQHFMPLGIILSQMDGIWTLHKSSMMLYTTTVYWSISFSIETHIVLFNFAQVTDWAFSTCVAKNHFSEISEDCFFLFNDWSDIKENLSKNLVK